MQSNDELDEKLWKYHNTQINYIITQFGIVIVGIGTLFIAYGSSELSHLKGLIALISLAGSIILWMHTFAACQETWYIDKKLRNSNSDFIKEYHKGITSWRRNGINKFIYYPVTRAIPYFMGYVSIAWLIILIFPDRIPSILIEIPVYYLAVLPIIFLAIFRRFQDYKKFQDYEKNKEKL
ncbi:MAG: hypothetical protein LUQ20_08875 [Candidatus Methanoperedens sp.]|nr:hypothetical protein [Candidatus Methanoperedens sp.]